MKNDELENNESNINEKLNEQNKQNSEKKKDNKKPLIVSSVLGAIAVAGVVGGAILGSQIPNQDKPPQNYVKFIDFIKNDNGVYSTEVEHTIDNLDFSKCIEVSENCTWQLFSDEEATQPIDDMLIALVQGYNTFYVKVSDEYGDSKIYALQIVRQNKSYLVTFNTFGGTSIETQSIEEGKFVTKPQDPVKEGYEFIDWNFDFNTPITEDTIITANYNLISYKITYNLNGGTNNGKNPVVYSIIDNINLEDATKNGYTFEGWYTDSKFETKVTEILAGNTGDIELYAKFEINNNSITYILDGGINNAENPENYTVETETITLKAPTKEGYNFVGWYTDDLFEHSITEIQKGSYTNLTLYAKWESSNLTVNFNSMGGSVVDSKQVKYGGMIEIPTTPIKNGYTFVSWCKEESCINEWNFSNPVVESMTLYAKYNTDTYNIVYNLDGGTNNTGNPENYTVETETIILKSPTKEGHNFVGWYMDSSFTNQITEIQKGNYTNLTLYAKWESSNLIVSFNSMGGSIINSKQVKYGGKIEPPTTPIKNGYTFVSWYREASYINKWDFSNSVVESMTLYAKYNKNTYNIVYNLDGGINNAENPENYTVETETITLKAPTKEGCNFVGWYTDSSFTNQITEIPKGCYSNIDLYAKWESGGDVELEDATFTYTKEGVVTGLTKAGIAEENSLIRIPAEINGVKITAIGDNAFKGNTTVIRFVISDGIKSIGVSSFEGCTNLTKVIIQGTVESISAHAFSGCSKLSGVSFTSKVPKQLEVLGDEITSIVEYSAYKDLWVSYIVEKPECSIKIIY